MNYTAKLRKTPPPTAAFISTETCSLHTGQNHHHHHHVRTTTTRTTTRRFGSQVLLFCVTFAEDPGG